MAKLESFVKRAEDVKAEAWDDSRGRLAFHTLISGGLTPSNGLTAGLTIVEPGGSLATHSHTPPEIYYGLEGAGLVTVDGAERKISAGDALFIPGDALHGVRNPFEETFRFLYVFPVDGFADVEYKWVAAPSSSRG